MASLIDSALLHAYLFGWLMGCQTAKTQTAACPYIFWSGHIKVNAWFLSMSVLLTCRSSLGTSSYVLESVEVLLEEVAHLVWETTDKVNLHKKWCKQKHRCFGWWPSFELVHGAWPPSASSHSQEGMPRSITDVSNGFHIYIVVMQWFWVCRRAHFCQEETEPPSKLLWAACLTI